MGGEKERYARGTNLFVLLRRTAVTLAVCSGGKTFVTMMQFPQVIVTGCIVSSET